MQDSYLFPTLDAGSSRVFNICGRTAALLRAAEANGSPAPAAGRSAAQGANGDAAAQGANGEGEGDFLFHTNGLNNMVAVKEARPSRGAANFQFDRAVGTKLYFPYNTENLYEGGKSAFVDDPQLERILADHAGLQDSACDEQAGRDLQILYALNDIPSLDPFLVKDKIQIEQIAVNDFYFMIPDDEWKAIRNDVADKLKPIIKFAFSDSEEIDYGRTMILVNKLWDTKDIESLMPIVEAFGLPKEEAAAIFSAWKGIMYYDNEYNRSIESWRTAIAWLGESAKPTDFVDIEQQQLLASLREIVRRQYREAWLSLRSIFDNYYDAYDALFIQRESPKPFVEFMRNAVHTYWTIGSRLSAINHSVAVWDILTQQAHERRLKYEPLCALLDVQRSIFESTCTTT